MPVFNPKQSARFAAQLNSPPLTCTEQFEAFRNGTIPGSSRWINAPIERKSRSPSGRIGSGAVMARRYVSTARIVRKTRIARLSGYDSAVLPAGTIVDGRYEIVAPLAEGGMGAVFRARRVLLGDEVALKIVRAEFVKDAGARERFLRESRACAQLRHPNIVSILDYSVDAEGRPFMVMELLNGGSLRQELIERGPFSISEVQSVIAPIAAALQLAHDSAILHRDLKPANIVAHDFGVGARAYKIVDFGLVRDISSDTTRLTGAHQFLGTITYAAPEQLMGREMDARSDQYSLAVVIYELLTGRPPFTESDPAQLVTALLTKNLRPPSEIRSDLPKWIDV